MKDKRHIKRFNKSNENLNISDVSDNLYANFIDKLRDNGVDFYGVNLDDLYNFFNKTINDDELSIEEKSTNITGYVEDNIGLSYDTISYMDLITYLEDLL